MGGRGGSSTSHGGDRPTHVEVGDEGDAAAEIQDKGTGSRRSVLHFWVASGLVPKMSPVFRLSVGGCFFIFWPHFMFGSSYGEPVGDSLINLGLLN